MNIFVANLNYKIQKDYLQSIFEEYGVVDSAKVIMDRETGRSKGFGFVEMPNDDEALAAIEELDGTELEGKEIVVKKANPKSQDSRGGGGFKRNGGGGNRRFNEGGGRNY
ncbi:MAG: RNA recognition motif domain-containing protein [Candidatus Cyclobacteriaceae bacterium M3_2C_046]